MRPHHISFYLSIKPTRRRSVHPGAIGRNTMGEISTGRYHGAGWYEIRLKGHLDSRWTAWFDGLSVTNERDGTTVVSGPVLDQAALHGLLQKVRDIGLPLVSVSSVDSDQADVPTTAPR
jgi:hypothetical protein